jgi:hypothetical protein
MTNDQLINGINALYKRANFMEGATSYLNSLGNNIKSQGPEHPLVKMFAGGLAGGTAGIAKHVISDDDFSISGTLKNGLIGAGLGAGAGAAGMPVDFSKGLGQTATRIGTGGFLGRNVGMVTNPEDKVKQKRLALLGGTAGALWR